MHLLADLAGAARAAAAPARRMRRRIGVHVHDATAAVPSGASIVTIGELRRLPGACVRRGFVQRRARRCPRARHRPRRPSRRLPRRRAIRRGTCSTFSSSTPASFSARAASRCASAIARGRFLHGRGDILARPALLARHHLLAGLAQALARADRSPRSASLELLARAPDPSCASSISFTHAARDVERALGEGRVDLALDGALLLAASSRSCRSCDHAGTACAKSASAMSSDEPAAVSRAHQGVRCRRLETASFGYSGPWPPIVSSRRAGRLSPW